MSDKSQLGSKIKIFKNNIESLTEILYKQLDLIAYEMNSIIEQNKNRLSFQTPFEKIVLSQQNFLQKGYSLDLSNEYWNQMDNNIKIIRDKQFQNKQQSQSTDIEKNLFSCPICIKVCHTVQGFCRHIIEYHNIKDFDDNFYCPYCEYHTKNIARFCEVHLVKYHSDTDQQTKKRFYFCPFQRIRYHIIDMNLLQKYIRYSTKYTKIDQQIELLKQQTKNNEYEFRSKQIVLMEKKKQFKPFIRGQTEIKFTQFGLLCPVCGIDGFDKLRILATHIKNIHNFRYPNNLFCPHCKIEFQKYIQLAEHLLKEHFTQDEQPFQRFYIIQGCDEKFKDLKKLLQACQNYMVYHTFFNPEGPSVIKDKKTSNSFQFQIKSENIID